MPFSNDEHTTHLRTLEEHFWSFRRPPEDIRAQVREGQRIEGQSIELFLIRPLFSDPSKEVEEAIAKIRYVRSSNQWKLYWKRADGKWHSYPTVPTTNTLEEALTVIHKDEDYCFFG